MVLLAHLDFLVSQEPRVSAGRDSKGNVELRANKDPEVRLASLAPPVLQVKVSKETKETKGQQVGQDRLVAMETLVFQAYRVQRVQ